MAFKLWVIMYNYNSTWWPNTFKPVNKLLTNFTQQYLSLLRAVNQNYFLVYFFLNMWNWLHDLQIRSKTFEKHHITARALPPHSDREPLKKSFSHFPSNISVSKINVLNWKLTTKGNNCIFREQEEIIFEGYFNSPWLLTHPCTEQRSSSEGRESRSVQLSEVVRPEPSCCYWARTVWSKESRGSQKDEGRRKHCFWITDLRQIQWKSHASRHRDEAVLV